MRRIDSSHHVVMLAYCSNTPAE